MRYFRGFGNKIKLCSKHVFADNIPFPGSGSLFLEPISGKSRVREKRTSYASNIWAQVESTKDFMIKLSYNANIYVLHNTIPKYRTCIT